MPEPWKTTSQRSHPLVIGGFCLLVGGALLWLWTGEWKWVITGLALLITAALIAGNLPRK